MTKKSNWIPAILIGGVLAVIGASIQNSFWSNQWQEKIQTRGVTTERQVVQIIKETENDPSQPWIRFIACCAIVLIVILILRLVFGEKYEGIY